jgi:hypothetical protein
MSYSRWGSSVWYTYWCVSNSDKRDDQIFDICSVTNFTYGALKKDLIRCLCKIRIFCPEASEEEIEELEKYMLRFIADVESDISFDEYDKVAACPEQELPLLLAELKTTRGKRALEHRLKGESLDFLDPEY